MRNRLVDPVLCQAWTDEEPCFDFAAARSSVLVASASPGEESAAEASGAEAPPPPPVWESPWGKPLPPDEDEAPVDDLPEDVPSPWIPPWVWENPAISASRILEDRPDVMAAYVRDFHASDPHSRAWADRVGGTTAEHYALYWFDRYGKYEGYNQGPKTAGLNVSLERILEERPDVLAAYYRDFLGPNNDRSSDAWIKRVGGTTPEDYARYWYEKYGKWEGYAQTERAALENINIKQLLLDRPDVFQAFFTEFYGPNNDRKSKAWVERVGGDTVEDYAKYWYVTYGVWESYRQERPAPAAPQEETPGPETAPEPAPPAFEEEPAAGMLDVGQPLWTIDPFA